MDKFDFKSKFHKMLRGKTAYDYKGNIRVVIWDDANSAMILTE